VLSPKRFLADLGADIKYIGIQKGTVPGKAQGAVEIDALISEVHPSQFDGIIIPGGAAPEALRLNKDVLKFVRECMQNAKPVAAICHGPQVLISAGVLKGRTLTSYVGIRDDVTNAGARYLDQEVVIDNNLVTSRTPQDLPAFNKAFAGLLAQHDSEKAPWAHATPSQVLEYAIFNEIKAMALYENLAKKSKDKLAKAKFKYLSEMERAHRDALIEIFEKINHGQKPQPKDLGMSAAESGQEIDPDADLLKVLRGAMNNEDSAYHLYSDIAEKVTHGEVKNLFRRLAEEEQGHKQVLEAECALRIGREIPSAIEKEPWWTEGLW
jgi:protease I